MLAEKRRASRREIAALDAEGRADEFQVAPLGVLDGDEGAAGAEMRVGVDVAGVAGRGGRYTGVA